jgi:hypothetical protein
MSTRTSVSEQLVSAISRAWESIQQRHEDVTDVMISIGSGTATKAQKWGHFAAGRWAHSDDDQETTEGAEGQPGLHELFVAGEGLRRPVEEVFATLLHESAHCIAHTRGIADTSRQGRYHNKRFKKVAEEVGLVIDHDQSIGWSVTRLPPSTGEAYVDELAELAEALHVYRHADRHMIAGKRKDTNLKKAECACEPPRVIRVAKPVFEAAAITCGACEHDFQIEEAGDEDQAEN